MSALAIIWSHQRISSSTLRTFRVSVTPGECGKVSATEVTDRRNSIFWYWSLTHFSLLRYGINKDVLQVMQLRGHVPSTGRHKWRHCKINNKMSVNLQTPYKNICTLWQKSFKEIPQFFSHSVEPPPMSVNRRRQNDRIPHSFRENWNKIEIFYLFFRLTRFFYTRKFVIISVKVRTVDVESLSEIATHNFKKSRNPRSPMEGNL